MHATVPAKRFPIDRRSVVVSTTLVVALLSQTAYGQAPAKVLEPSKKNVPYADAPHERQVLDIYVPTGPDWGRRPPVVFWIHGGGWQVGDKTQIALKPEAFTRSGYVFVSTNYRLLPHVDMGTLIRDVAKSLGWVHKHIAEHEAIQTVCSSWGIRRGATRGDFVHPTIAT